MENKIKQLRKERKMTQIRLAVELSVSQETVSAYEKGKYFPSFQSLAKMREIFGCSMDYIMGYTNRRNYDNAPASPEEERLISHYHLLSKTQQEKALAYIQGLLEQ